MSGYETILERWDQYLPDKLCYTEVSSATRTNIEYSARDFGLRVSQKLGHGLLAFGDFDTGDPGLQCLPWMLSPWAPERSFTGGRHGLILGELYDDIEQFSFKLLKDDGYFNDEGLWRTYIFPQDEANYGIMTGGLLDYEPTNEHITALRNLVTRRPNLTLFVSGESDLTRVTKDGVDSRPYGKSYRYVETIAEDKDVMGRTRELEYYASTAQKHGLDRSEFVTMVRFAVESFHSQTPVNLDALCKDIISQRN